MHTQKLPPVLNTVPKPRDRSKRCYILFLLSAISAFLLASLSASLKWHVQELNCFYLLQKDLFAILLFFFLATLLILFYSQLSTSYFFAFFIGLIVGCGLYHIYIRFMGGCVIDYLHIGALYFDVPDFIITTSVITLLISSFKDSNSVS
jgi:hypothetical protein